MLQEIIIYYSLSAINLLINCFVIFQFKDSLNKLFLEKTAFSGSIKSSLLNLLVGCGLCVFPSYFSSLPLACQINFGNQTVFCKVFNILTVQNIFNLLPFAILNAVYFCLWNLITAGILKAVSTFRTKTSFKEILSFVSFASLIFVALYSGLLMLFVPIVLKIETLYDIRLNGLVIFLILAYLISPISVFTYSLNSIWNKK